MRKLPFHFSIIILKLCIYQFHAQNKIKWLSFIPFLCYLINSWNLIAGKISFVYLLKGKRWSFINNWKERFNYLNINPLRPNKIMSCRTHNEHFAIMRNCKICKGPKQNICNIKLLQNNRIPSYAQWNMLILKAHKVLEIIFNRQDYCKYRLQVALQRNFKIFTANLLSTSYLFIIWKLINTCNYQISHLYLWKYFVNFQKHLMSF
jgi:hypothetical protein